MSKHIDKEKHIFKFVSFNANTLKNIINGELWFGKPKNQNDPYEGEFVIDGFSENLSETNRLKIIKQMFPNERIDFLKVKYRNDLNNREFFMDYTDYMNDLIKDQYGICCFSKTFDEILLWTHYADSHQGMCLIYDMSVLNKSFKENYNSVGGGNANYSLDVPRIKVELHENGIPFINGFDQLIFKYKNFEYEQEFRFIKYFNPRFSKERNLKIDNSALFGIIFGESMPINDKRTIINLMKSIPAYKHVKFYISTKNLVTRKIRIEIIHEKHPDYYELFKDQGAREDFPIFTRPDTKSPAANSK